MIYPKPKKRKRTPGQSLAYLDTLWRQVVRKQWGNRCALAGTEGHVCEGPLEAHHFIPRVCMVLRHDPANGVLLCKAGHATARHGARQHPVCLVLGPKRVAYLAEYERILFADWRVQHGITRQAFRRLMVGKLRKMLEEEV